MDTWLSSWAEFNSNHPTWKNRECADCKSRLISTIKNKKLKHTLKEIEIETETFLWPGKTDFARYGLFFFTQISTLHSNRNPLPFVFFVNFSLFVCLKVISWKQVWFLCELRCIFFCADFSSFFFLSHVNFRKCKNFVLHFWPILN